MHQPAWTLYAATRLAGITPTARGLPLPPAAAAAAVLAAPAARGDRGSSAALCAATCGPSAGGPLTIEVALRGRVMRFRSGPEPGARRTSRCGSREAEPHPRGRSGARGRRLPARPGTPPTASTCAPTRTCSDRRPTGSTAGTWSTTTPSAATRAATARCTSTAPASTDAGGAASPAGSTGRTRCRWSSRAAAGSSSTPGTGARRGSAAPGFGGIGSDVWVMTRDGRRRTNLTRGPEFSDNFHAYWSPDGRHIAWTELNWNAGRGRERPLRDPRGALRPERPGRPAARGRARGASRQRALVRDAVVGARRLGLPLHGDHRHGHRPGAVLLPAARPGARALPALAAHPQPRVGRAGGVHAGHGPRDLHVLAPAPRRVRRLVARGAASSSCRPASTTC